MDPRNIQVIAFDADDTLWDCQSHFEAVERLLVSELAPWGAPETVSQALWETETGNMAALGFGSKAFCISLVETAIRLSDGAVDAARIGRILAAGKSLLRIPATPFPGVRETLAALRQSGRWKMVVFTKGDQNEQEDKLNRSGLMPYFDEMEIAASKGVPEFRRLCNRLRIAPEQLLMVGNSFKSDIEPLLQLGGSGILVPAPLLWKMEHAEEYDHPGFLKIGSFPELLGVLS